MQCQEGVLQSLSNSEPKHRVGVQHALHEVHELLQGLTLPQQVRQGSQGLIKPASCMQLCLQHNKNALTPVCWASAAELSTGLLIHDIIDMDQNMGCPAGHLTDSMNVTMIDNTSWTLAD